MATRKMIIGMILAVLAGVLVQSASAAVIYVDKSAVGSNNGSSWQDAFNALQDALDYATSGDQIRVADRTYQPWDADPEQQSFELVSGVDLYGGYAGFGAPDPDERNGTTILNGADLGHDVVSATDVSGVTIDRFTITKGRHSINLLRSSVTIKDNNMWFNFCGIYGLDESSADVVNCEIRNNADSGIFITASSSLSVQNCEIRDNGAEGIYCSVDDEAIIKNNLIHHNDDYGIWLIYAPTHTIRNNTIADNGIYGITSDDTAELSNCIIWGKDQAPFDPEHGSYDVTYSCIDDCDQIGDPDITHNICVYPKFYDGYHLLPGSPCLDTGDPTPSYTGETDTDGEPRRMDGDCDSTEVVDMGADEVDYSDCWRCPTQCYGDADCDGDVDFVDLGILRVAFFTTYCDYNSDYNPCADFDRDGNVNFSDLGILKANIFDMDLDPDCPCGGIWPPKCL
jgi:parallel beta-helix repeat protein